MKRIGLFTSLLLSLFLFGIDARAQDATPSPGATPTASPAASPIPAPHVDAMEGHLELDDIVELHVQNLERWAETHDVNKLVPYINGRAIRGDYPDELHLERGRIIFHLRITPESKDAWIDLLGEPTKTKRPVSLSLGLENGSAFDTV